MRKMLTSIIFICIIACVASHLLSVSSFKNLKKKTSPETGKSFFDYLTNVFNKVMQSLKNPIGPNVNPRNICVWKICSKPLKNRQTSRKFGIDFP